MAFSYEQFKKQMEGRSAVGKGTAPLVNANKTESAGINTFEPSKVKQNSFTYEDFKRQMSSYKTSEAPYAKSYTQNVSDYLSGTARNALTAIENAKPIGKPQGSTGSSGSFGKSNRVIREEERAKKYEEDMARLKSPSFNTTKYFSAEPVGSTGKSGKIGGGLFSPSANTKEDLDKLNKAIETKRKYDISSPYEAPYEAIKKFLMPGLKEAEDKTTYDYLTDDEKKLYAYYTSKGDTKSAKDYLDYVGAGKRKADSIEIQAAKGAAEHPIASGLLSVPYNMAGAAEGAYEFANTLSGGKLPGTENFYAGRVTDAIRNVGADSMSQSALQLLDKIGIEPTEKNKQFLEDAYGFGLDMLNSLAAASLSIGGVNIGGGVLGLSAARSAMNEAKEKGATADQILLQGLAQGIAEMLFESVSIGQLKQFKELPAHSVRDYVTNILKANITNASEEALTELSNVITDYFIMGEKSDNANAKNLGEAIKNSLPRIAKAGVSGALMGGVFGTAGSIGSYNNSVQAGRNASADDLNSAINYALNSGDEELYRLAANIQERQSLGSPVSNFAKGDIIRTVQEDQQTKRAAEMKEKAQALKEALKKQKETRTTNDSNLAAKEAAGETEGESESGFNKETKDFYGKKGQEVLESNWSRNESKMSRRAYENAFYDSYMQGLNNRNFEATERSSILSEAERKLAYNAGLLDREANITKKIFVPAGTPGVIDSEAAREAYAKDKAGFEYADMVAKAIGINLEYDKSALGNGYYKGRDVVINPDSKLSYKATMNHETTHFAKEYAPEAYMAYRDFTIGSMFNNNKAAIDEEVDRIMDLYARNGIELTYDDALDEIAADSSDGFLDSEEAIDAFIKALTPDERTAPQKILDFIKEATEKLQAAIKKAPAETYAGKMLRQDLKAMQKAEKLWIKAIADAKNNTAEQKNWQKAASISHSITGQQDFVESGYSYNTDGDIISDDGNIYPILNEKAFSNKDIEKEERTVKTLVKEALANLQRPEPYIIKSTKQKVYVEDDFAQEYTESKDMNVLHHSQPRVKLNIFEKVEEMIEEAWPEDGKKPKYKVNTEDKHNIDAKRGWNYYNTGTAIKTKNGYNVYEGVLNIRLDASGKDCVYDITDIKKVSELHSLKSDQRAQTPSRNSISSSSENASDILNEVPEKKRFSITDPVEQTKDLIAIHNLNAEQMLNTLELGGFPMPSIAITKADMGHDMYGDVSVLFRKDTIDPKAKSANKVYSGDAYTPEFPHIDFKIDGEKIRDVRKTIKDLTGNYFELFGSSGLDSDNAEDKIGRNNGNVYDAYGNSDVLKYAYTLAKGQKHDIPTKESTLSWHYDNDEIVAVSKLFSKDEALKMFQGGSAEYNKVLEDGTVQKIIDTLNEFEKKKYRPALYDKVHTKELSFNDYNMLLNAVNNYNRDGIKKEVDKAAFSEVINEYIDNNREGYESWLNDLFSGVVEKTGIRNKKDAFLPSGNRRSWEALHEDFNLANIVKAMKEEEAVGQGFGGFSFFGSVNREFESIDDIRSEKDRLQVIDQEKYDVAKEEIEDELKNIAKHIGGTSDYFDTMSAIAEAVAKRKTSTGVKSYLSQWYKNITDKDVIQIMSLAKKAAQLPTGYFEAKPRRAVGFDEIAKVIVPDVQSPVMDSLIKGLNEKGIPYEVYKAGDKEARKEAVNNTPNVRFSISEDPERVFYVRNTEVVQNPTDQEYSQMREDVLEQEPWLRGSGEPLLRHTYDENGNEYYWAATGGLHSQIEPYINRRFNTRTSQQYEWWTRDDKDDYPVNYERRYSITDLTPEEIEAKIKENKELQANNKHLQKLYENAKRQVKLTKEYKADEKAVRKIARSFLKEVNSKYDLDEFTKTLSQVYETIYNSERKGREVDMEEATGALSAVLEKVFEKSSYMSEEDQMIRDALKGIELTVTDEIKRNIPDWNDFRKEAAMFRLRNGETSNIDTVYEELHNQYPWLFSTENNSTLEDMLYDMVDTYKAAGPKSGIYGDMREYATAAAIDLIDRYSEDLMQKPTYADKKDLEMKTKLKALKAEQRQALKDAKNELAQIHLDVMRLEIKAARQKYKDEYEKRLGEKIEKYKEHYKDLREKDKKRAETRKVKDQIVKSIRNLRTLLFTNNEVKHIPAMYVKSVATLLEAIDLSSGRPGTEVAEKLQKYKDMYRNILDSNQGEDYNITLDDDMPGMIDEIIKKLDSRPLRMLDDETLLKLRDVLTEVETMVRNANMTFLKDKKVLLTEAGSATLARLDEKEGKKTFVGAQKGVSRAAADLLTVNNVTPAMFFDRLGGYLKDSFESVRAGEGKYVRNINKAKDYALKQMKKYNFNDWYSEKELKRSAQTFNVGGKTLTLDRGQIMSLYVTWQRDQGKQHITTGGITSETQTKKGKFFLQNNTDAIKLSEEDVMMITGTLSEDMKKFADAMRDYLAVECSRQGNEVTMNLFGIKKFGEEKYFPVASTKEFLYEKGGVVGDSRLKHSSFTKTLVAGANNPIALVDFMSVWADHVDKMAKYSAYTIPLEGMTKLWNYREQIGGEGPQNAMSVRSELTRVYGAAYNRYILDFINDVNGVRPDERGNELAGQFMSLMKKGAVMGNVRVAIQQPSAIVRAFAYINPKYFTNNMKGDYEELAKWNSAAAMKKMGYFDTGMGASVVADLKQSEARNVKEQAIDLVTNEYGGRDDALSFLAEKADEVTWGAIWRAVKAETKATTKLEVGSDEFMLRASERFTEIVDATQVYDSVFEKSDIMRSTSTFSKMVTAFMSEPTKTYSMLWRAATMVQDAGDDKKKKAEALLYLAKVLGSVLAQWIVNDALTGVVDVVRNYDDSKSLLQQYKETFEETVIKEPLGLVPYLKDIVSIFEGYNIKRTDMQLFQSLYWSYNKIAKKMREDPDKLTIDDTMNFAGSVSSFFGIPISNIYRDLKTGYQFAEKMVKDFTGITAYENSFEGRVNRFYDYNLLSEGDKSSITEYNKLVYESVEEGKLDELVSYGLSNGRSEDQIIAAINYRFEKQYANEISLAANAKLQGEEEAYEDMASYLANLGYSRAKTVDKCINKIVNNAAKEEQTAPIETPSTESVINNYYSDAPTKGEAVSEYKNLVNAYTENDRAKYEQYVKEAKAAGKSTSSIKSALTNQRRKSLPDNETYQKLVLEAIRDDNNFINTYKSLINDYPYALSSMEDRKGDIASVILKSDLFNFFSQAYTNRDMEGVRKYGKYLKKLTGKDLSSLIKLIDAE